MLNLGLNKHRSYLLNLEKGLLSPDNYHILYSPADYKKYVLEKIKTAQHQIYLVALYLENDEAGREIIDALFRAQSANPNLTIKVLVDWHRAQRGRIGEKSKFSNADYYYSQRLQYPNINIPFYGVPINTKEMLGVLHLKGCIIDDEIIYSGASFNNVYLNQFDSYRYDRYHCFSQPSLAKTMVNYLEETIISHPAVNRLDVEQRPTKKELKFTIKSFRRYLSNQRYQIESKQENNSELSACPIVGLSKSNPLNRTIHHLISATQKKVIICTPYFNLPSIIAKDIIRLLRKGKEIEIIVGDKKANDFFIPENEPFKIIGGLPYLYEMNLRKFAIKLQKYIDTGQLKIRLWKDEDNSYHLKGIWVDQEWMLITGNNINPRGWRLDLENGILVHDPKHDLSAKKERELDCIREHTILITHYQQIQSSQFYPKPVKKLIKRMKRIKVDALIRRLL